MLLFRSRFQKHRAGVGPEFAPPPKSQWYLKVRMWWLMICLARKRCMLDHKVLRTIRQRRRLVLD